MIDINTLSLEEKAELLKAIFDSEEIEATAYYGATDTLHSSMVRVENNKIYIDTDICTG